MRSGSFERGDQPRSVQDPDGDAYDAMLRAQAARHASGAASTPSQADDPPPGAQRGFIGRHPDFGGSVVPVLGSAREAYADYLDGDVPGAVFNGLLAATDLAGGGLIAEDVLKGGLKLAGSHTWKATRRWLGKEGILDAYQHGHHALIPRNGWGKAAPDAVKNQPFNIKPMPSPEVHGRIHGPYAGKPQYNALQRFWYGTPRWWKGAAAEVGSWFLPEAEQKTRDR